jgi:hypothetical protein
MTNALSIYNQFDTMQRTALALYKSGYFQDATSEAQAIVKVMAGAELGLPPFASMTGIHIIKGKPVLGANLIATLIKQHPSYNYRISRNDDDAVHIDFFENGEKVGVSSFSMKDAQTAGLLNNPTWKKFPRNMLFSRAISNGARWYTPDIFGGSPVYTPDEFGLQVDEDGDVVEGEVVQAQPTPEPEPQNKRLFIEFQQAGKAAYNGEWDNTRPKLVAWLTNDRVTSSKEMTNAELETGIAKLKARAAKNAQEQEPTPEPEPVVESEEEDAPF